MELEQLRNIQIEQEVLSCIIQDNSLLENIKHYNKELFYNTEHQEIFKAIKELNNSNINIDQYTLSDYILKNKLIDKIRPSYVCGLSISIVSNFNTYVATLKDYYIKRKFKNMIQNIDFSKDGEEINNNILKQLNEISKEYQEESQKDFKEYLFEYINNMYETEVKGLETGLIKLDEYIGGFNKGELITIAARSGIGKTTLAIQIILNMINKGYKLSLFSLEIPKSGIIDKFISNNCKIEQDKIRKKQISETDKEKALTYISQNLTTKNIEIYEAKSDIEYICNRIKRDKINRNIDIAFIDLINRVSNKNAKGGTRAEYIGSITRKLKLLALELQIPIVITAQINRTVDQRQDARPTVSDIKESGGIEEDSDLILGLYRNKDLEDPKYRQELYKKGKLNYSSKDAEVNPKILEVALLKARYAEFKRFAYTWEPSYQRVDNIFN